MDDEFLILGKSFTRLYNEYKKYGNLVIGYDFDGTVFDFHSTGATYHQVIALLRGLKEINCKVICWTSAKDINFVSQFLTENDIPFDGINTPGVDLGYSTQKPFFSALLDDRAGLIQVHNDLSNLLTMIKNESTTAY